MLVSIRRLVSGVVRDDSTGGLSIDAQVTNFAWNGSEVVSLDTTPPLIWDVTAGPFYDVGNYLTAVPALLRPIALRLTKRAGNGYRTVRGVLEFTAMIPMIKRLARLQRFWAAHVRRTRYEFFITNSFTGEIY